METERNPNEPIKPTPPGQQGDRDKEKDRIVTKRKIARNRVAANRAADANKAEAKKEAVSKADDKFCAVN